MGKYKTGLDTIIDYLKSEKERRIKAYNSGHFCDNEIILNNITVINNVIELINKSKYCVADSKEKQIFQLGDTVYLIDEDYNFWESTVKSISLNNGKYYYETSDVDFEFKDIGDWVFESPMYRELHLEAMIDV